MSYFCTSSNTNEAPPVWDLMFRIIVLGDSDVGKSCLVRAFVDGSYKALEPTVGVDFAFKVIQISADCTVKLQIWDTAGGERFRAITHSYYRNSAGAILAFDVSSRSSFNSISKWMEEIRMYSGNPSITIILVGTKIDVSPSYRAVSPEEALALAEQFKINYVEVSSKNFINIGRAFNLLTGAIYQKYQQGLISHTDELFGISLNSYLMERRRETVTLTDVNNQKSQKASSCCGSGGGNSSNVNSEQTPNTTSKPI